MTLNDYLHHFQFRFVNHFISVFHVNVLFERAVINLQIKQRTTLHSTSAPEYGGGGFVHRPMCWLGLPPVPNFPGCPGFALCCPASQQDQPRDVKCPEFQGAVKMTTIIITNLTIVIIGVIKGRDNFNLI